jgi:putative transposase
MRHRIRRARQHELAFKTWGGARPRAGRKPTGPRARTSHRARPAHCGRHPVHVTLRLQAGLPSLRRKDARAAISRAFAAGRERFGFRLTHFSLQTNHVHLITEANDRRALSRGMQGLLVRLARALNRLWNRRGSLLADRFHARALRTPREVRSALVYVLHNARHHGLRLPGIDPCSSGPWFDGWKQILALAAGFPGVRPSTWLLREGWRRHGLIGIEESPSRESPQSRTARPALVRA